MRLWRPTREGRSHSEVSLDSTVPGCGSSAPEAPKGVIRGAQIAHKRHLVGSEKCRLQGQITAHSRRAGGRAEGGQLC